MQKTKLCVAYVCLVQLSNHILLVVFNVDNGYMSLKNKYPHSLVP